VFLYNSVLGNPLGQMSGLKRVQKRHRIPVVLGRDEVKAVFEKMEGTCRLMAELIYGAGLRVHECVSLRFKDVDLTSRVISIRNSKGCKDRTTVLPEQLFSKLQQHMRRVAELHRDGLARGAGLAPLPVPLKKYNPTSYQTFHGTLSQKIKSNSRNNGEAEVLTIPVEPKWTSPFSTRGPLNFLSTSFFY
jgi:site-specific recombinase XerD